MRKDKEWLKKELAVDIDNAFWRTGMPVEISLELKIRANALIDQLKEAPADHIEKYLGALRAIDSHVRCTKEPVDFIIHELKKVLPEYKEDSND